MDSYRVGGCALALSLAVLAGCAATSPGKLASEDRAGDLRQARIEFRQRTGGLGAQEVSTASYSAEEGEFAAIMTIEYPHPDGDKNKALATVVVPGRPDTAEKKSRLGVVGAWADHMLPGLSTDEGGTTARALSIDKRELDKLLRESVEQGALENAPSADSQLVIEINGARQASRPQSPDALRDFAKRVRREGRVVAADHPHVAPHMARRAATGDKFYESLEGGSGSETRQ